jgi:hypothetical protein
MRSFVLFWSNLVFTALHVTTAPSANCHQTGATTQRFHFGCLSMFVESKSILKGFLSSYGSR